VVVTLAASETLRGHAGHAQVEGRHGIPREFTTKSRVIIICNDWRTLNQNVAALQDRGHVLVFQPSAAEVHAQAGEWFKDAEIYEWFGKNLHRMREPSFRHYVRARELKAAGMEWTEVLAVEEDNRRGRLAAEILASGAYGSTGEMVRASSSRAAAVARRSLITGGGWGMVGQRGGRKGSGERMRVDRDLRPVCTEPLRRRA
jgi:hypothetical protein